MAAAGGAEVSRWRAPQPGSTAIITPEGHRRLKDELDDLWRVRRPEVVRALAAAAAEGDRSENAEYTYRKKQLGEIDRRVRYISKRLESVRVISEPPSDAGCIFFGAWFDLENLSTGERLHYRIVGPDETDADLGHISIDSPVARAALKKRVDDEFSVELPSGPASFAIVAIRYVLAS